MKKCIAYAVMVIAFAVKAEWERNEVNDEIYSLYDEETATLVVKGKGTIPRMPRRAFIHLMDAKTLIICEGITAVEEDGFRGEGYGGPTNIIFEAGVTNIGNEAFAYNFDLVTVHLPETLETLGENIFWQSQSLKRLTIPENLARLSNFTFSGSAIEELTFLGSDCTRAFADGSHLKSVCVQPGVGHEIFEWYFGVPVKDVVSLKTKLQDGFVYVQENASEPYAGDLVLPPTWKVNGVSYPVKGIEAEAFKGCTGLTSIRIPDSVTSIGAKAFSGCANLKSIRFLGERPDTIGADSFEGVSAAVYHLRSAKSWGGSSKTLGGAEGLYYHGFGPVDWLMEVAGEDGDRYARVMPNTTKEMTGDLEIPSTWEIDGVTYPVREVAANAFSGCTGISSVEVPSCIRQIDDGAFAGCSGLKRIHFCGDKPTIGANGVFAGVSATVYYPPSAEGWEDNSETWGGANSLSYDPLDGYARRLDELLYMLNDESLNEIPIILEEGGSFENSELVVEVPEGKILIVDLNDQTIRIKSWVINGQMYLDNYSGTGWLFGNVDVGPKGKFYSLFVHDCGWISAA